MKKMIAIAAAAFVALPAAAFAAGLTGQCVDCHTMHNSEQGNAVAVTGLGDSVTQTPLPNLLRMDCIACHVVDPAGANKIVDMGNGSAIPQVMHQDSTGDLAGGNWTYAINGGTGRNAHNVRDLMGTDNNGGTYGAPPGKFRDSTHGPSFGGSADPFSLFTCAGSGGCHGTRSQMLDGTTNDPDGVPASGDETFTMTKRVGIPAVSGAHHANFDGAKNADNNYQAAPSVHDGAKVADGYRMIPGLIGYGNETERWQNNSATSHNEYYGVAGDLPGYSCGECHISGTTAATAGGNSRMTLDSTLRVPNQSMSGFCATCHGVFHSVGTGAANFSTGVGKGSNGVSGAFQRHPSDYIIPNSGEYAAYTTYSTSAPVARPTLYTAASDTVAPGTDMVMCLSCHVAHGSEHDYLLRFDYAGMVAGTNPATDGTGCLACHTTKGKAKGL